MPKFRKRPVIVSAEQWRGHARGPELAPMETTWENNEQPCEVCNVDLGKHAIIRTLEGAHRVCPGDWIITGIKGEQYPCKPDIFSATYEPVDS